jgi:hypothetical protein
MALGRRPAVSLGVDACVVDDGVHAPDRIDLVCDALGFGCAAEISDCNPCGTRREPSDGCSAVRRAGVQHHLMALMKE